MAVSADITDSLRALRRGGKLVFADIELAQLTCCRLHSFCLTYAQLRRGEWCASCPRSEGERRCRAHLLSTGLVFHQERAFPSELRYVEALRLDFYVLRFRLVVEYDGAHHFAPVPGRSVASFVAALERDEVKNAWCRDTGRSLLRIPHWRLGEVDALLDDALSRCAAGEVIHVDEAAAWRASCLAALRRGEPPLPPPAP